MPWSVNDTTLATAKNDELRVRMRRQVERCASDRHVEKRQAYHECKACYYYRRPSHIAGRAMTPFICAHCSQAFTYTSTAVPKLCQQCADRFKACRMCGGLRDDEDEED